MNAERNTRLVLAGVLAGVSTLVNITPLNAMPPNSDGSPSVLRQPAISQAALNVIDAKVQHAATVASRTQARFYQIIRGPFVESGPDFVQSWNGQMRLP